jgi:hypothetical protein
VLINHFLELSGDVDTIVLVKDSWSVILILRKDKLYNEEEELTFWFMTLDWSKCFFKASRP